MLKPLQPNQTKIPTKTTSKKKKQKKDLQRIVEANQNSQYLHVQPKKPVHKIVIGHVAGLDRQCQSHEQAFREPQTIPLWPASEHPARRQDTGRSVVQSGCSSKHHLPFANGRDCHNAFWRKAQQRHFQARIGSHHPPTTLSLPPIPPTLAPRTQTKHTQLVRRNKPALVPQEDGHAIHSRLLVRCQSLSAAEPCGVVSLRVQRCCITNSSS